MPTQKFQIKTLRQTCLACPSQWEGETTQGDLLYIRYRWGELEVYLNEEIIYESDDCGDGLDGILSTEEVLKTLHEEGFLENAFCKTLS